MKVVKIGTPKEVITIIALVVTDLTALDLGLPCS